MMNWKSWRGHAAIAVEVHQSRTLRYCVLIGCILLAGLGSERNLHGAEKAPQRPILLMSSELPHEALLRANRAPYERKTLLPQTLSPYSMVWLADESAIRGETGKRLQNYVEDGGALLTSGKVLPELAHAKLGDFRPDGTGFINQNTLYTFPATYLGVKSMVHLHGKRLKYPSKFLGVTLGEEPRPSSGNSAAVLAHNSNGRIYGLNEFGSGILYTYTSERGGRFINASDLDDLENDASLRKLVVACIRWLGG